MKVSLIIIALLTSVQVLALDCQILVITDQETLEKNVVAPQEGPGHGAPEFTVAGQWNQVTAMADGQWLGIQWKQNDQVIAETLTVLRDPSDQPRTLLVYNPNNLEEQASVSCQKN